MVRVTLGGKKKNLAKKDKGALSLFLQTNPRAKIVIIVDTHSTQDSQLMFKIKGEHIYSDYLGPVSSKRSRLSAN